MYVTHQLLDLMRRDRRNAIKPYSRVIALDLVSVYVNHMEKKQNRLKNEKNYERKLELYAHRT